MGQYYRPVVGKKVYGNYCNEQHHLAKLMEHSWIKNPWVNAICRKIKDNPKTIYWCGDYADEINPVIHKLAWKDHENPKGVTTRHMLRIGKMFLINQTKKEYINMAEYIKANTKDGWCVHPLPLLTAIGNGLGGGDYHGPSKCLVGYWAGDKMMFSYGKPDGYTDITEDCDFEDKYED